MDVICWFTDHLMTNIASAIGAKKQCILSLEDKLGYRAGLIRLWILDPLPFSDNPFCPSNQPVFPRWNIKAPENLVLNLKYFSKTLNIHDKKKKL